LAWRQRLGSMVKLPEGVYCGVTAPCYETPAESTFYRNIGADLVGMSTVQETLAARQLSLRTLGLGLVTNLAAGVGQSSRHAVVLDIARTQQRTVEAGLRGAIEPTPEV